MERCICANKELVASCVHPYCPEHGWDEERDAKIAKLQSEVDRLTSELDRLSLAHTERSNKLIAQRDLAVAGRLGMPDAVYETLWWALESMPLSKAHPCDARTVAMIWIDRARTGRSGGAR